MYTYIYIYVLMTLEAAECCSVGEVSFSIFDSGTLARARETEPVHIDPILPRSLGLGGAGCLIGPNGP